MRVLHFFVSADSAARLYAATLAEVMEGQAETRLCHSLGALRKALSSWHPNIVNVHGCWHLSLAMASSMAARRGARVVLTPHGQLEPWILHQRRLTDKLPRLVVYQRRALRRAFAVVAMGRMEATNLLRLGRNSRVETVYNSLVTDTISHAEMGRQMLDIYEKVLDTDVAMTMDGGELLALRAIFKAGIAGDARWLTAEESAACTALTDEMRHKLLIFACEEGVNTVFAQGVTVLDLPGFSRLYASVDSYAPSGLRETAAGVLASPPSDVETFLDRLRQSQRLAHTHRLTFAHVVAMVQALRRCAFDEDKIVESLKERKLTAHAARVMHVMAELTGLEEGFMSLSPRSDRKAAMMLKSIKDHRLWRD